MNYLSQTSKGACIVSFFFFGAFDAFHHFTVSGLLCWISIVGYTEGSEAETRKPVRLGGFGAGIFLLAGKLGSKVRTEPPMIPTTRMERTLMWNPHRVLERRLRVETDWQFIL